ncbi:MAG TPA: cupin domain-containing protein [Syntrophomonas sp.]|nr:cupin domain-containing protein [Syntrophomonas sp.]
MNLFRLPPVLPDEEIFEALLLDCGILIERIISCGQVTPAHQWYDQERDEWVLLLQGGAKIGFEDSREQILAPGDWLLIPAHTRHRVTYTSAEPPCIWLAVHAQLGMDK